MTTLRNFDDLIIQDDRLKHIFKKLLNVPV